MNRWGIPDWLEEEARERDKACVYCGIQMVESVCYGGPRQAAATWEHIIHEASAVTREDIAPILRRATQVKAQRSSLAGSSRVTVRSAASTGTRSRR